VLADDPGSTILTLTSFGMVQRSRPHGRDVTPVVALCKDPVRGTREIQLETGAHGILLTLCGDYTRRRSADGRSPVDNVTHYFDVAVHQVRAVDSGLASTRSRSETRAPRVFESDDLSVITGWAQAVAEALVCAPERLELLLRNALPCAPWRTKLRLAQPSRQFSDAVSFIAKVVRPVSHHDPRPTFDDAVNACREDRPDPNGVEMLARRILRSALDQLQSRRRTNGLVENDGVAS